jgi:signal transduction histidine kinase
MSVTPGGHDPLAPHALEYGHLVALHRVSKLVVTASLDLNATLIAIVEAARDVAGAEHAALLLLEGNDLVFRFGRGASERLVGERLPSNTGVSARALREGRPVLVPDMWVEPDRAPGELGQRTGARGCIVAPLIWHGRPLGVVSVGASQPAAFAPGDAAIVGELAELAAAALARASAFAEEQRLRTESEDANRRLALQAEQLERPQTQLTQNEKLTAIGQRVHGLAHEMNTPLNVVISNLAVLDRYSQGLTGIARAAQQLVPRLAQHLDAGSLTSDLAAALAEADLDYVLEDLPQLVEESTASARRLAAIVRSLGSFARRDSGNAGPVSE